MFALHNFEAPSLIPMEKINDSALLNNSALCKFDTIAVESIINKKILYVKTKIPYENINIYFVRRIFHLYIDII